MLTLEQIEEGRRIQAAEGPDDGRAGLNGWHLWLERNAEALLAAAERVARDDRGPSLDWVAHDEVAPFPSQEVRDDVARGQLPEPLSPLSGRHALHFASFKDIERARARDRWDELRTSFVAEFRERPMVVDFALAVDPRAYAPNHVQAWLRARGLEATVMVNPSNPRELLVDPLRVTR
jgi:hypothetical protein